MKSFFKSKWAKYLLVAFVAFMLGNAAGSAPTPAPEPRIITKTETKTVEKRVEVAPLSCKRVINLDNQIFTRLGNDMQTLNFDGTAEFIKEKTPGRTADIQDCMSK